MTSMVNAPGGPLRCGYKGLYAGKQTRRARWTTAAYPIRGLALAVPPS